MRDAGRRFIGRQHELSKLQAALTSAVAGQPGIVLLAGEPGIGKTHIAQEMAGRAASQGVLALWGRCPEEPGAPPYWPWLQLIRRYAALQDRAALRRTMGPAALQLAALDPELAPALGGDAPSPTEPDPAASRFRLFDAIAGFWRRAAAQQPLLLVLDDLHRADVPSLRLLEFVMAECGDCRLMLLGTYRDAEVTRHHPLSGTLAELHRHAAVQRLLLGGFSAAETAQFVAAAGVASSELALLLYAQTEGHPLFLAELAHDLDHSRPTGPGAVSGARGGAKRVPHGVREVMARA